MSRHNFAYFAREGAYNMFSHGFMSFAAIGITVACLLIMGTFTLVAVNANAMLEDMESHQPDAGLRGREPDGGRRPGPWRTTCWQCPMCGR